MDLSSINRMALHSSIIIHITVSPDQFESVLPEQRISIVESIQNI